MTALARLIARLEHWTGLDLERGSAHAALARYLRGRVAADDPEALARYVDGLVTPQHPEVVRLVDAITVCHSSFYRDAEQLSAVAHALRQDAARPASIWVAACATGEDAYTLALVAESVGRRAKVLATDINARALAHAQRGEYGAWSVRDLPPQMALTRRPDGLYEVPPRLRAAVSFARHNLMDPPPSAGGGGWDLIICRNVFMYLSRDRVDAVLRRLAASLRPGGYLFIGANDILDRPPPLLRFVRIEQRHVLWRPTAEDGVPVADGRPPSFQSFQGFPSLSAAPLGPIEVPPSGPIAVARATTPRSVPVAAAPLPAVPPPPPPPAAASAPPSQPAPAVLASLAEAHALLERNDTPAALALLLSVLDSDPLCIEARLLAGIAYHLENDALQAASALRGALVLAPELWPAEMYLGFVLARLGDDAGSGRALRRGGALAASTDRLPLSPPVAAWLESWRVDAIAMANRTAKRADAV